MADRTQQEGKTERAKESHHRCSQPPGIRMPKTADLGTQALLVVNSFKLHLNSFKVNLLAKILCQAVIFFIINYRIISICGEIDQQSFNISVTPLFSNCEKYSGILTFGNVILRPSMLCMYLFVHLFIYRFSIINKQATQTYHTF